MYPYLWRQAQRTYQVDRSANKFDLTKEKAFQERIGDQKILCLYFIDDDEIDEMGYAILVTKDNIFLLDDQFEVMSEYTGLNIHSAEQKGEYLYIINEIIESVSVRHYNEDW